MALRFAIIRHAKTHVGEFMQNVVYEEDESEVIESLLAHTEKRLIEKRSKRYLEPKYSKAEILQALRHAFYDTIEDFKRVTIKIL